VKPGATPYLALVATMQHIKPTMEEGGSAEVGFRVRGLHTIDAQSENLPSKAPIIARKIILVIHTTTIGLGLATLIWLVRLIHPETLPYMPVRMLGG